MTEEKFKETVSFLSKKRSYNEINKFTYDNDNDNISNDHISGSDYGNFEDSNSENILKRGIKTKNSYIGKL